MSFQVPVSWIKVVIGGDDAGVYDLSLGGLHALTNSCPRGVSR